jgi:hypothetical protein
MKNRRLKNRMKVSPEPVPIIRIPREHVVYTGDKTLSILQEKLFERLAFEKIDIQLYSAIIKKALLYDCLEAPPLHELEMLRDEKLDHFQLVLDSLKETGADYLNTNGTSDSIYMAAAGMLKIISSKRTTISQGLYALLSSELTDRDSWEILIQLAEGLGLLQLAENFEQALTTEEEHLQKIRVWLSKAAYSEASAA